MNRPISRADLPLLKDLILDYDRWRQANGLEPDSWWKEKIRAALEADGLVKPKGAA